MGIKKKMISLLLASAMLLSTSVTAFAAGSLDNFQKEKTYTAGQFADVPATAWYHENVRSAYEYSLMEGISATNFKPAGNLTIAETLTIATRLNCIYYGVSEPRPVGLPWYEVYVDYCEQNGIIRAGEYTNFNQAATRAQFASILAASVPEEALPPINSISAIPDVPAGAAYASSVLKLYNAGVLNGNNEYGTFGPATNIIRGQVAAIITRIADPGLRLNTVLKVEPTGITLNKQTASVDAGKTVSLTAAIQPEGAAGTVLWSTSNSMVATVSQNGKVTGVQAGTAVITASVGNWKASCMVTVTVPPVVYKGNGSTVITGVNLPAGDYYAEMKHSGSSNFIVDLWYGSGSYDCTLLANEIGRYSGQAVLEDTRNTAVRSGMLEVKADGAWEIAFKPVSGTSTTNIQGNGDIVTGYFTASTTRAVVSMAHNGSSNFIVQLWEAGGGHYDYDLVANEIGSCSGQKVLNLVNGQSYFFSVIADGKWTIDLGLGDSVTTYSQPTFGGGDNDDYDDDYGSGDNYGDDDSKYDFSEAKELNGYASKATDACSSAMNRVLESYSGIPAEGVLDLNFALHYAKNAKGYLESVRSIIDANVDLNLTNSEFATFGAMVDDTIDLLDQLTGYSVDENSIDQAQEEIQDVVHTAYSRCIKIQSISVELMEAFA